MVQSITQIVPLAGEARSATWYSSSFVPLSINKYNHGLSVFNLWYTFLNFKFSVA